jgi:hypothetical protein
MISVGLAVEEVNKKVVVLHSWWLPVDAMAEDVARASDAR